MNWHRWLATPTGLATSRPKFGGDAICRSTSVASFWTRELRHSVQRALPLLVGRDRKFADSLLEGRVTSEPVSEVGFFGAGKLRPDSKTFMDDTGSVRALFRARISRNFCFCPSADFSADIVLSY
jgi:hypothetical protein